MTEGSITFSRKEQIDLDNEISESEKISFNQIIKNHNLNTEQQKAFLLYVSTVFDKDVAQRLIYMTGEGGTGKSRVIMLKKSILI